MWISNLNDYSSLVVAVSSFLTFIAMVFIARLTRQLVEENRQLVKQNSQSVEQNRQLVKETRELVKENRLLRELGTKPELIAHLRPGFGSLTFDLIIDNIGIGVAKNISFRFECDGEDFEAHNVMLRNEPLRGKHPILLEKKEIAIPFVATLDVFHNDKWLKPFKVILEYQDIKDEKHERTCELDASHYEGLRRVYDTPPVEIISKNIKDVNSTLKDLLSLYRSRK